MFDPKRLFELVEERDEQLVDILCDLLRSNLLPEAYVPSRETRETKNVGVKHSRSRLKPSQKFELTSCKPA